MEEIQQSEEPEKQRSNRENIFLKVLIRVAQVLLVVLIVGISYTLWKIAPHESNSPETSPSSRIISIADPEPTGTPSVTPDQNPTPNPTPTPPSPIPTPTPPSNPAPSTPPPNTPVEKYQLTAIKEGNGNGTIGTIPFWMECYEDCVSSTIGYFGKGNVALIATASSDSVLAGWSEPECLASSDTCVFWLNTNKTVYVTFNLIPTLPSYTLTITKNYMNGGTVSSDPTGSEIDLDHTGSIAHYPSGTSIRLSTTPAAGYTFSGWSGGRCSGVETCTINLSADTTVAAAFAATL